MFTPGNLLYFKEYYFDDGSCKPKYFLVLSASSEDVILNSLPTSKDREVPSNWGLAEGCNSDDDAAVSFYFFPPNKVIVESCEFCFDVNTYLIGRAIKENQITSLKKFYNKPKDIEVIGKIKDELLIEILNCFSNSKSVLRKYKKIFQSKSSSTP